MKDAPSQIIQEVQCTLKYHKLAKVLQSSISNAGKGHKQILLIVVQTGTTFQESILARCFKGLKYILAFDLINAFLRLYPLKNPNAIKTYKDVQCYLQLKTRNTTNIQPNV